MNQLCLLTNLTSSEWAAWVQAVGSIAAIVGAASIAIWQSASQQTNAIALQRTEQRQAKLESARTLLALSTNCARAMKHAAQQFPDRESLHRIADLEAHFDFNELRVIEGAVLNVPLHSLPHSLVSVTMIVSSTVRQFREKVESALRFHRQMNSGAFEDFFSTIAEMQGSLAQTCRDIEASVASFESEA